MKILNLTTLILVLLLSVNTMAQQKKVPLLEVKYTAGKKDNLAKAYRRFIKADSIVDKNTPMVKKTVSSNPQVKNWRKLKPGTKITLYLQKEYLDKKKVKRYFALVKKRLAMQRKLLAEKRRQAKLKALNRKSNSSLFYMASLGNFTQSNADLRGLDFFQNSPITLGISHNRPFKGSYYSLSTSLYASYLLTAASNIGNEKTEVAPEIGTTFYIEKKKENWKVTPYVGFDLERFSSININEAVQNNRLFFDQHFFTYITAGIAGLFNLGKRTFLNKLSFSHSVMTSLSSENADTATVGDYSGFKVMWHLNTKISKRLFLHSLLKFHSITGPSTINSYRIGLGLGYIL